MALFIGKRLVGMLVTLLVASFLVYGALYVAPGSPLAFILGHRGATAATIAAVKAQYHLNDSFPVAYWRWLLGVVQGNFGQSYVQNESVVDVLKPRVVTSLFVVSYASLLIFVFGIGSGALASLGPKRLRPAVLVVVTVAMAVPAFVWAVVLIIVFGLDLGWFPTLGQGSGFFGDLYHLSLPAFALALSAVAFMSRVTAAAVDHELKSEHVETARARGIPERLVVRKHVLRNAWIPVSTVAGLSVASLIAGDAIVEVAFGLNGVGSLLVQSVEAKDFPVVQMIVLLLAGVFVVVNMIVDVGYALADPRVRIGASPQ